MVGVLKNITSNCIRDAFNYKKASFYCLEFELFKTCHLLQTDQKRGPKRDTKVKIEIHQEIFEIIFFSRSLMLQFII